MTLSSPIVMQNDLIPIRDAVCGFITQVGLNPTSVSVYFPWGGGFTAQFASPTSVVDASTKESPTTVVDAWKKSGNVSDKALEVSKMKLVVAQDEIKKLQDALKLCQANLAEAEKGKHEAEFNLDQMHDELASCQHSKAQMIQKVDELTAKLKEIGGFSKEEKAKLNGLLLVEQDGKEQLQKAAAKDAKEIQSLKGKWDAAKTRAENLRVRLEEAEEALALERSIKENALNQVHANETLMHAQVQKIDEQRQTIYDINTQRTEELRMAWEDTDVGPSKEPEAIVPSEIQIKEERPLTDKCENVHVEGKHEREGNSAIPNTEEAKTCNQSREQQIIEVLKGLKAFQKEFSHYSENCTALMKSTGSTKKSPD